MRTLGERILAGDARAYGKISDMVRARGGTYQQAFEVVQRIHRDAGRPAPDLPTFDEKMAEADDLESGASHD